MTDEKAQNLHLTVQATGGVAEPDPNGKVEVDAFGGDGGVYLEVHDESHPSGRVISACVLLSPNEARRVAEALTAAANPPDVPRDRAPANYAEQRALLEDSLRDIPPERGDA